MAACYCNRGWICEQHRHPWPHDDCPGPGVECLNPTCPYGLAALERRLLDDAHDRAQHPKDFDERGQRRTEAR
jgi:hypothetical protein